MPDALSEALTRLSSRPGLLSLLGVQQPPDPGPVPLPPGAPVRSWADARRDPLSALVELAKGLVSGDAPLGPSAQGVGALAAAAMPFGRALRGASAIDATRAYRGARMTKEEAVAAGLWHPIGEGKRLSVPVRDMQFQARDIDSASLPAVRQMDLESLSGASIVPAIGDRTSAGKLVTNIGGVDLPQPVQTHGGPDFMRTHDRFGASWASDKGAASRLSSVIRKASAASRAAGGTGDVYMVYMPMGHGATDFNTMMSDAVLEQLAAGRITKRVASEFDAFVRRTRPEWVGIGNPAARQQLRDNGELRHAFIDATKLDRFQSAGFPDLATTRAAITDPALIDAPSYMGGSAIAKMDPSGRVIASPAAPHPTYNTQLAGQYAGKFEKPLPIETMFPDFTAGRRAQGKDPMRDIRAFMMSTPFQVVTPAWVQANQEYLRTAGMVAVPVAAHQLLDIVDSEHGRIQQ